jgi:cob(I)alamin adenosyltransferase
LDKVKRVNGKNRKSPGLGPVEQGLVVLNTGRGKGKTTAALGLLLRALGHDMRVCVMQFIKRADGSLGEYKAARQLGIEWHQMGDGFTWRSSNMGETEAQAHVAWALAQEKIRSGAYDMIVLDEFTYVLKFGWLDVNDVVTWLEESKSPALHLVITGRDALPELVAFADLVTDMHKVKHPFDRGVRGQPGIEF